MKKYLPIGSVIKIKEMQHKFVIAGRDYEEYDYIGVLYPIGHMHPDIYEPFNHNDIDEIFFVGFQDEDELAFAQQLSQEHKGEKT